MLFELFKWVNFCWVRQDYIFLAGRTSVLVEVLVRLYVIDYIYFSVRLRNNLFLVYIIGVNRLMVVVVDYQYVYLYVYICWRQFV